MKIFIEKFNKNLIIISMITGNFDIENFAKDLSEQANEEFSPEIPDSVRSFITQVIYEFIKIAYDALGKEERIYNIDESILICQLIGEWMYHRGIDNYKNEIPQEYWKPILQQVAFAIWEAGKESIIRGDAKKIVIDKAQTASDNAYFACISQLARENKLTKSLDEIKKQSNLNDYVEENYNLKNVIFFNQFKERKNKALNIENNPEIKVFPSDDTCQKTELKHEGLITKETTDNIICKKIIIIPLIILIGGIIFCTSRAIDTQNEFYTYLGIPFFVTFAFSVLFYEIHSLKIASSDEKFWDCCIVAVVWLLFYFLINPHMINMKILASIVVGIILAFVICKVIEFLISNIRVKQQIKELEQVKKNMQKLVSPNECYKEIEKDNDILLLKVSGKLIPVADPEQEGKLCGILAGRRKRKADEIGYVLPNVRIQDTSALNDNEYVIYVQNELVFTGEVYPDRVMVIAEQWDSTGLSVPEDAICGVDMLSNVQVYWLLEKDVPKYMGLVYVTPAEVIVNSIEKIAIKYVDYILSVSEVVKYNEIIKKKNKSLLNIVLNNINIADIRVILVELIKEEYSIKAILLIYEKIAQYSVQTKDPKEIADKIKKDLGELKY